MYKNEFPAETMARMRQSGEFNCDRFQRESITEENTAVAQGLKRELTVERDRYLALVEDFDNYRKERASELERQAARQKEAFARDLLPAVGNLEGMINAKVSSGESLYEGAKMIHGQMIEMLRKLGFEPCKDGGKAFCARGIATSHRAFVQGRERILLNEVAGR
jgi:molecular chaperone GrpE (heat shock protein)